jgi:hypothetical protein
MICLDVEGRPEDGGKASGKIIPVYLARNRLASQSKLDDEEERFKHDLHHRPDPVST